MTDKYVVPLTIGEGANKKVIGEAEVTNDEKGLAIQATILNPEVAKLFTMNKKEMGGLSISKDPDKHD